MLFDISGGFRCILAHQIIASTEMHEQTGIHWTHFCINYTEFITSHYITIFVFSCFKENPSFFDKVFCLSFREKCINTISLYGMSTNRVKIKKGIYG